MGKIHEITDREKELLNALGKYPEISMKKLLGYTRYKRVSSISRKFNQFKEQRILRGPVYDIDYNKLCKNTLHWLFCILETRQSHETVISYLKPIEPLIWTYPVLSPHKELLCAGFISSNDTEVTALFQLLKENGIISDYIIRVYFHKRVVENPDFFGDSNPSLDGLLNFCELPDMPPGQYDTEWDECDIAILPYLEGGYKGGKLIEILKAEKKLNKTWTYEQIKYSREKMIENKLIEKTYVIFPFPPGQCAVFILFVKTENTTVTRRILHNFARGERVYRHHVLCKDWGVISCICYPPFLTNLMYKLDQIDQITEKELYQLRSLSGTSPIGFPSTFDYYDFENQTLRYPYRAYEERIKERIDELSC